jgi:predicted dienelactone hydrolase
MKRRSLLRAAAAALLAPCSVRLPADEAAAEPFEAMDFDWHDAPRQRALPVRLYLPRSAGPRARVPLVVFSHGIGGSRRGYSWLGHHWARHGVASLHLQHVGSDRSLWTGNPLSLLGRLHAAAQEQEALARVHDLRAALDRLLASEIGERVDDTRLLAAGHSYGANTTLLAAGARVQREGRVLDLAEPRLRAALLISAPPFYGEDSMPDILAGVTLPTLHVTATEDVIRIPGYYSDASDRLALYQAIGSRRKWLAVFEGGSHSMFTDRQASGGLALNAQVKAATRELALAFVQHHAGLPHEPLDSWPRRHAALLARSEGFAG